MTERDWLGLDVTPLLDFVLASFDHRKIRLLSCGYVRWFSWDGLAEFPESRRAVEIAERFADGQATVTEMTDASGQAWAEHLGAMVVGDPIGDAVASSTEDPFTLVRLLRSESDDYRLDLYPPDAITEDAQNYRRYAEPWHIQCGQLIREIFGNPFRSSAWATNLPREVVALAEMIDQRSQFDRMPELAEALEAAGCADREILDHCRSSPHLRGCWVIDSLLGKHPDISRSGTNPIGHQPER